MALFMFVIPALVIFPASLATGWSAATSPYLDDDVRTYQLISSLSLILRNMVYWLFPVWLFRAEFSTRFPNLPPFWVLVSLPMVWFLVTGLLPFFLGAYRFRAQSRHILQWRKQWIEDWLRTLDLPPGPTRVEEIQQERMDLDQELSNRLERNEILALYSQTVFVDGDGTDERPPEIAEAPGSDQPASISNLPVVLGNEATLARGMVILRHLRTGNVETIDPAVTYFREIRQAIVNNAPNLVEWDLRFDHIAELYRLRGLIETTRGEDQRSPLTSEIDRINTLLAELEPKRSFVFGGILTLLGSGLAFVFRSFNTEIVSALQTIIQANLR